MAPNGPTTGPGPQTEDGLDAPGELRIETDGTETAFAWPLVHGAVEYRLLLDGEEPGIQVLASRCVDGDGIASGDSPAVHTEVPPEPDLPAYQPRVVVTRQAEDGSRIREVHETDTIEEAEELAEQLRQELADDDSVEYISVPGRVTEMSGGMDTPADGI